MHPLPHPIVSVIIPTYNRREQLAQLLSSLGKQSLPASQFEVIIVDDGSTDGTLEWISHSKEQFTFTISSYNHQHSGPGVARNLGMEKARGTIFAFIDTDCIADPEWLKNLISPFHAKKVGAVGGCEIINDGDPFLMRCFHYLMTSPLTTGGIRGKKGKALARFYPRTFNMAISKEAYQATRGFKPLFHAEDIELSYRIKEKGYELIYQDSAKVYHRRRNTITQFVRQLFSMGKARVTLTRLHPKTLEPLHTLPALAVLLTFLLIILSFLGQPLSSLFLFYCMGGALYLSAVGIHSFFTLHSPQALILVPLCFLLQQAAYGSGFLFSLIHPEKICS